jgi:hypothetical protein
MNATPFVAAGRVATPARADVAAAFRADVEAAESMRPARLGRIERRLRRRYARRPLDAEQLIRLAAARFVLARRGHALVELPPGPGVPSVEARP